MNVITITHEYLYNAAALPAFIKSGGWTFHVNNIKSGKAHRNIKEREIRIQKKTTKKMSDRGKANNYALEISLFFL